MTNALPLRLRSRCLHVAVIVLSLCIYVFHVFVSAVSVAYVKS